MGVCVCACVCVDCKRPHAMKMADSVTAKECGPYAGLQTPWTLSCLFLSLNSSLFLSHLFILKHFYTSASSCLSSSLLPSSFVACLSSYTRRRNFLSKALVYCCFLVFCRIGECICPDLFYFIRHKKGREITRSKHTKCSKERLLIKTIN